jgi:hypothetical protein
MPGLRKRSRTVRSECLDWLLIVSAQHLERALTVFIVAIPLKPSRRATRMPGLFQAQVEESRKIFHSRSTAAAIALPARRSHVDLRLCKSARMRAI